MLAKFKSFVNPINPKKIYIINLDSYAMNIFSKGKMETIILVITHTGNRVLFIQRHFLPK